MKTNVCECPDRVAVTGVLGYSGRYMARKLVNRGVGIVGLTNSVGKPNPDGWRLSPLCWDDPVALAESMRGCRALINTYWVRFNSRWFSHAEAVEHTRVLFEAAAKAGVERIVHISITHPDRDSSLSYFRGKAELERMLESQDIPYSVLRPAVLFGERPGEDILINNMAWVLRNFPVVGIPENGEYRLQPIHVEDLAALAVREAMAEGGENRVIEAVRQAVYSPLIETDIQGATGIIVNIVGGKEDLRLQEIDEICNTIKQLIDPEANIILGVNEVENKKDIEVTVIATGFGDKTQPKSQPTSSFGSYTSTGYGSSSYGGYQPMPNSYTQGGYMSQGGIRRNPTQGNSGISSSRMGVQDQNVPPFLRLMKNKNDNR